MHVKLPPLVLGWFRLEHWQCSGSTSQRVLDVLAHVFLVLLILYGGLGHLVTSVSSPTTLSNDTEAYLHTCDRVTISRSDGYRPLKLSSGCVCIIEEAGES
jgi:hypothetical protein